MLSLVIRVESTTGTIEKAMLDMIALAVKLDCMVISEINDTDVLAFPSATLEEMNRQYERRLK